MFVPFRAKHIALAALVAVTAGAQAAPLKIGLVETLSGSQASTGLMFKTATRYVIDQINADGGWDGEPVQLVEYDNQGGPAGASDKVKAALADGVQLIIQGSSSAVSGQITEDVRKFNLRNPGKEVVFLNVGGEALELTGDRCHFHHFRFNPNAQVRVKALVGAMKLDHGLGTKVYSINQNYSWGHDMEAAIVANAEVGGYKVVEKTLHDTNRIQDFAPYVNKIIASQADTVLTGNWSNDLLLLMKASKAAGLNARFGTTFLDQPGNIANAGDVALGNYVVHPFNADANGAQSEQFAEDYKSKTGHYPVYVEGQTVFGLQMVASVLKNVKAEGGKLNTNTFAKTLEKAKFNSPLGESQMRADDHQILLPIVVSKVAKDARYKADNTDMGFKTIKLFTAEEAAVPPQASCKMKRPS
ncbi:branched-chain amino acid ABC transporter substrate-binding protein [Comamonas faecalis]|uniref:Branched-chain amino acid ABC transporter substrate-binding protein n=1 Tax=Comamonas faecalis TaxID=1387849 RepID=A0ABP7R703_9BURK